MNRYLTFRRLAAIMMIVCLPSIGSPAREASRGNGDSDLAVVVHPHTPVRNLTLNQLRQVFRGEQQYWSKDMPVVLLVYGAGRQRDVTLRVIYQMDETQYRQYWIARVFRDEAVTVPKVVYSVQMAKDLLELLPGCIAVLEARDVRSGMRVIRVNGLLPGEQGYSLR